MRACVRACVRVCMRVTDVLVVFVCLFVCSLFACPELLKVISWMEKYPDQEAVGCVVVYVVWLAISVFLVSIVAFMVVFLAVSRCTLGAHAHHMCTQHTSEVTLNACMQWALSHKHTQDTHNIQDPPLTDVIRTYVCM